MHNINSNYSELKADTLSNPFKKNQGRKITEIMRNKGGLTKYIIALVFIISFITCITILISKSSQLKSIAKEKQAYERQIKEIQASNEQITRNIKEIEESVTKLTKEKNDLVKEEAELKKRKEELTNENKIDYDKEIQQLNDQLEAATIRYDQMKKDNPYIDKDKGELEIMVQKYKEELASLQQEYEKLRKELGQKDDGINNKDQGQGQQRDVSELQSAIITQKQYNLLLEFLGSRNNMKLIPIYQARNENFYPEAFHEHVADKTNTVIVLKLNNEQIIGGFTAANWIDKGYKNDPHAFLFNLTLSKKFPVSQPERAIYCDQKQFPIFGNGDLIIKAVVESNFPISYGNSSTESLELTNGIKKSDLNHFEVYAVMEA